MSVTYIHKRKIISHKIPVILIILASYTIPILDGSIAITGLSRIRTDLGFSDTGLSWVQNAYTLSFGGLLLLGARAGDIFGLRRIFILGLAVFAGASVVVGLAQSPLVMLGARATQGAGAAILTPSTLALFSVNFPEGPERTHALAYHGTVAGISTSLGLALGGILADRLSWRVGFFINLPISAIMIIAAFRYISETERQSRAFDVVGALGSACGMTALVYGIVHSAAAGWSDTHTLAATGTGSLLLVLFAFNERRARQPIMPLRLFSSRERAGAYMARILYLGGMAGFWFFVTLLLQRVFGYTPFAAGLAFLPMTVSGCLAALAIPGLTRRLGNARLLVAGIATSAIGMAWLGCLSVSSSYLFGIALPMILFGVGQGCTLSPLTVSGIAGIPAKDAGAASGLINVVHQLGGALGLGILVVVFASGSNASRELFLDRAGAVLHAGTLMLLLALAVTFALIFRAQRPHPGSTGRQRL